MYDDREEFDCLRRVNAQALAKDVDLIHRAFDLQTDSAEHRFAYLWSWLGVPIIQVPTDIVVIQEIIWETQPDLIIETGVARGGSLLLSASMLQLIGGSGRVVGVDIDIRGHNYDAIMHHRLASRITLIEGSSTDPLTVSRVREEVKQSSVVMVILDSDHSHSHVLAELNAYSEFVTPDSFIIVCDTCMIRTEAARRPVRGWTVENNPGTAVATFLTENHAFERDEFYNNKLLITSNPGGYIRRRKKSP